MTKKLFLLLLFATPMYSFGQISFTDSTTSLDNELLTSGVAIGVSDMNGDGLDDIIRLDNASDLEIEYQTASGTFTRYDYGDLGSNSEWGFSIADVDKNGYNDIIAGGFYNGLKLLTASSDGSTYSSQNISTPSIFLQNINFADIDNNGTIDIFACHDEGVSPAYSNDGSGNMTHSTSLIDAVSPDPSDDNSGNYGTIWTDYDNDGDQDLYISKCRLGVSNVNDGRRVNILFQNDGNNNYTDVAASAGLQPLAQSWSSSFEDIDNDGDLDCVIINHDISSKIYTNNGSGVFTDITATSGITSALSALGAGGIQVIMEDFDNDTYVDIFITARFDSHRLFKNDGDNTFTEVTTPFTTPSGRRIQSAAVGDLNNDGFIDVMAGFAGGFNGPSNVPDILFLNTTNSNNWSEIILNGFPSNKNGIGARVEIYGAWGKQIREVRSGESYGTMNSLMTHFGLGSNTSITKIVVKWPSGIIDELLNPTINTVINLTEGVTLNNSEFNFSNFKIHPNPAQNFVTIEGIENLENVSYEIYTITGKHVLTSKLINSRTIDLSSLTSGMYFINLKSDSVNFTHKIIKQ